MTTNPNLKADIDNLIDTLSNKIRYAMGAGQLPLRQLLHAITEAEMEMADLRKKAVVAAATQRYMSYAELGEILGISRQGARKTYGPMIEAHKEARYAARVAERQAERAAAAADGDRVKTIYAQMQFVAPKPLIETIEPGDGNGTHDPHSR